MDELPTNSGRCSTCAHYRAVLYRGAMVLMADPYCLQYDAIIDPCWPACGGYAPRDYSDEEAEDDEKETP